MIKMPFEHIKSVFDDLLKIMKSWYVLGFPATFVVIIGWYTHSKRQRKRWSKEIERVSAERDKYQSMIIGKKNIHSSKKLESKKK